AAMAAPPLNVQTRRFGVLIRAGASSSIPGALTRSCGLKAAEYSYSGGDYKSVAAKMQVDGVTSVLNPDPFVMVNAAGIGYFPEWIFANGQLSLQSQTRTNSNAPPEEMKGAFGIVDRWRWRQYPQPYWYQAYNEVGSGSAGSRAWGASMYDSLMMAFTAIQMAGARLTPNSVRTGLEGFTAAYEPSFSPHAGYSSTDHSFIDDFMIGRWDPSGTPPGGSANGCLRLADGGKRYASEGPWPTDDRAAAIGSATPCNADESNNEDSLPDQSNS
ncbi:MAG: ABC transporter substrate-binding protein, partial [Candidatus Dormibacteria bacterium]